MSSEFAAYRLEEADSELDLDAMILKLGGSDPDVHYDELVRIAQAALRRARAAEIVAAWQSGDFSEEQAARLLGVPNDPVAVRELLERYVKDAKRRWALRLPKALIDLDW